MVSRTALALVALLCVTTAAGHALDSEESNGRLLLGKEDNSGYINAKTKQAAANKAVGSKEVNQANANQVAQAAGKNAWADNGVSISQENGRKLMNYPKDNSGVIKAKTKQAAANKAEHSDKVNQANANQVAQAAGKDAYASNDAKIEQKNGRKLSSYPKNNSGDIKAKTKQAAANKAVGSDKVNQANANQVAQAAGKDAYANNGAKIEQKNGRKLSSYPKNNSGDIKAKTKQAAANKAVGSDKVNQANANQVAQAAGKDAYASNAAKIEQKNGRKLSGYPKDNSGDIKAKTKQAAANKAVKSSKVNQANANQVAQAAGKDAWANNDASISQENGRKLMNYPKGNSGAIKAKTEQAAANKAEHSKKVNQANANQVAQAAGKNAYASNGAKIEQENGRKLMNYPKDNSGAIKAKTEQAAANEAKHSGNVNQANVNQVAQAAGKDAYASNDAKIEQKNGRKLMSYPKDNSGEIKAKTKQAAANKAVKSSKVNQANANQVAQAAGKDAWASNDAKIEQKNGK